MSGILGQPPDRVGFVQVSTQMKNAGVNYNDPLEGMIKSHAILWIYSTYHEDSCKRGSAATKVKRCILLGSKAIDLRNTLEHSLEPESIEPDREDSNQKGRQIVCMNNYCKTTYSTCTIQSAEDKHKETNATSLAELKDGVREYIAKRAEVDVSPSLQVVPHTHR